ncbi:hypothetical protein [Sphaerotilus microaerophilus]|uniref:Phage-related protein n=1 Tax=Sphaerotilus microaerophilus TaxID=2914710 RepID=A0ABM7YK73_9BURK|nr:hypothetical protein [Sphaerotilus sp. FB-5]BDI04731.1 hypothetical protein CATMQ487_17010 [Sphaerotilus sp. FB-5]
MPLATDLSTRLDAGALVSGFLGQLSGHGASLGAINAPEADTGGIDDTLAGLDAGSLAPLIANLAQQGSAALVAASGASAQADPLAGINQALALVEQLSGSGVREDLEALFDQLGAELEGTAEGGTVGLLLRLSRLLADSPQGGSLVALLRSLLGATGVQVPGALSQAGQWLPAAASLVRSLGGLMMLESVLEESQRLTGLMAQRLDAGLMQRQIDQLASMLDPALAARVAGTGTDDAALAALRAALAVPAGRVASLRETLAAAMGLGEATLAYLDVDQVQTEVATAAALLRDIDLAPVQRLLQSALGGLRPLMQLDLSQVPAQSLGTLLDQVQAQVGQMASQIEAFDPGVLLAPLQQGVDTVTAPLENLAETFAQVQASVRAALQAITRVAVELPVGELAGAIQTLLQPVTQVLQALTELVAGVAAALEAAATQAQAALGEVEGVVDDFKAQLQALFGEARAFVEGLDLPSVVGGLSDRIADFTQALQQAQLKPYFDTAVQAIDTATGVVDAVPFDLLPESMKADVDAAVEPIKAVDLAAFETRIEQLVGIGPDGRFTPRADLEAAVAGIQAKFDALVQTLRDHDPAQYLQQLDQQLAQLSQQVSQIAPAVSLQPVQDAIDQVRSAVAGFDLRGQLQPLQQVFDDAIAAMQAHSPAQLIVPLEQRVDEARAQLLNVLPLQAWREALDGVQAQALALLDRVDPVRLEPLLAGLLTQARDLLATDAARSSPAQNAGQDTGSLPWLGTLLAALHRGSGARLHSHTFPEVQRWILARSGVETLAARTRAIADAVARTHGAVTALDLGAATGTLATRAQPLRTALASLVAALPAESPHRQPFTELALQLDVATQWGDLAANQARYLARLEQALPLGETLRRTGLSEVDEVIGRLHAAFEPLLALLNTVRAFLRTAGLAQVDQGIAPMLQALFDVAPPQRLAALTAPLFVALRGRLQALLNAVILPVQTALQRVQDLIDAVDLTPLREAVDEAFQAAVAQVQALSPATLLAAPLAAAEALQAEVAAFNPLQALLGLLNGLRDTVARVLAKLNAQELLADPVAIYREIVDALDALNLQALMAPVLDLLDSIAHDVDSGLDDTVGAFQRLQDALPSGGGGSSGSVSVTA